MSTRAAVVDSVVVRGSGQVTVQVAPLNGVDLEFVYRSALGIHWNAEERVLEDRSETVESAETSAARVARAMREEYGMSLKPSANIRWRGVADEAKEKIARALFGRAC